MRPVGLVEQGLESLSLDGLFCGVLFEHVECEAADVCHVLSWRVAEGIPPSALSDPYVKLSLHTAPIRQTCRPGRRANVQKDLFACELSVPGAPWEFLQPCTLSDLAAAEGNDKQVIVVLGV